MLQRVVPSHASNDSVNLPVLRGFNVHCDSNKHQVETRGSVIRRTDKNPARGRQLYLYYVDNMRPRPKKKEYIWVYDGCLERLKKKPKGLRIR